MHGQSESVLYSFSGGSDGANPYAGLVLDRNGNMYGTTFNGGGSAACSDGCGTIFKATKSGGETTLYRFGGDTDGAAPYGGVIFDNSGNLYGTTIAGGFFVGTVFELNSEGVETPLYVFQSSINGGDGAIPFQALTRDGQGNLYGTTDSGGTTVHADGMRYSIQNRFVRRQDKPLQLYWRRRRRFSILHIASRSQRRPLRDNRFRWCLQRGELSSRLVRQVSRPFSTALRGNRLTEPTQKGHSFLTVKEISWVQPLQADSQTTGLFSN